MQRTHSLRRLTGLAVSVLVASLVSVPTAMPSVAAAPVPPATGMKMWLDSGDPDADGNSANHPSDNSPLTVWKDKSGNGNDATVLSGKSPGIFRSSTDRLINAKPVIQFNRLNNTSGSIYNVPTIDIRPVAMQKLTIFTVYRYYPQVPLIGLENYGVWGNDNGNWDRFYIPLHTSFGDRKNDGVVGLGPQFGGATVVGGGVPNAVRLMTVAYDGDTSTGANSGPALGSKVYFDGKVITEFTDTTHITQAQTTLRIGWDGDNSVFNGDVAEMIIYDRILTSKELNDVNQYLRDKYTLQLEDTPLVVRSPDGTMVAGDQAPSLAPATATLQIDETTAVALANAPTCSVFENAESSSPIQLGPTTPTGVYIVKCSGGSPPSGYTIAEYVNGTFVVSKKPVKPPKGGELEALVPFEGEVEIPCVEVASDPQKLALAVDTITEPKRGSTKLVDGVVKYFAPVGEDGKDDFTCTIVNEAGLTADVDVKITIRPERKPLVIAPCSPTMIDVIEVNDLPAQSRITEIADPEHGRAKKRDGQVQYKPDCGYYGPDSITALVEKPNNETVSASVTFTVGLAQKPVDPLGLPKRIKPHGSTTLIDHSVLTNADQNAKVRVTCSSRASLLPQGDTRTCVVKQKGEAIVVRTFGDPVTVTVRLSAPAKDMYGPYRKVVRI